MGYCSEPPVDHVSKAIIGTIIRKYSISTNMEIYNENRIGIYIYMEYIYLSESNVSKAMS